MSIISETGFIFCNTPFCKMSSFFLHIQGTKERDAQFRCSGNLIYRSFIQYASICLLPQPPHGWFYRSPLQSSSGRH